MKLRIGIAENPDTFKKLYSESSFVNMYGELQGQKNKIIAKELKEAAEKEPLIYNKEAAPVEVLTAWIRIYAFLTDVVTVY